MAQSVKALQGDAIVARDGEIGSVRDVYFDDRRWAVRYLVVDTGKWLPGKRVLVSPAAIEPQGVSGDSVRVKLTREQVKSAPNALSARPVSRQQEMAQAAHFGYPYYWNGPRLWGASAYPVYGYEAVDGVSPDPREAEEAARRFLEERGDPHLRSSAEVIGYDIEARDGDAGQIDDLVVDDRTWAIRDFIVDTRRWWPGGRVRLSPEDVEDIDWAARKVRVRLTRDEVARKPAA